MLNSIEFNRHFAARLREYMAMIGMSQKDLALKMGVSNATVSDWVNAHKCPRMDKIDQMVALFGCTRSDLIDPGKPERSPEDDQINYIIGVAKMDEGTRARLLAYAVKLRELYEMENERRTTK